MNREKPVCCLDAFDLVTDIYKSHHKTKLMEEIKAVGLNFKIIKKNFT